MAGYGDFSFFYDALMKDVDYPSRFDYIRGLLADNSVSEGILLDMACGTGTLSALFSKSGFDVIGVDASEDMLSLAQEKRLEEGFDALFLCQKMEELDLFGTIDAAVCTLDSLNHVTEKEKLKEIFRRTALFMNDKGVFVFDVNTLFKHRNVLADNTFVFETENVFCVWQNTLLEDNETTLISLDLFEQSEDGEDSYTRYSEEFCERGYELDEIKKMLEGFRFEVVGIYDDMTKDPVREDSERAVFVCVKHGTQFI